MLGTPCFIYTISGMSCHPNVMDFPSGFPPQDGESELYEEVPMVEQGYHSTLAARYHGEVVFFFVLFELR